MAGCSADRLRHRGALIIPSSLPPLPLLLLFFFFLLLFLLLPFAASRPLKSAIMMLPPQEHGRLAIEGTDLQHLRMSVSHNKDGMAWSTPKKIDIPHTGERGL